MTTVLEFWLTYAVGVLCGFGACALLIRWIYGDQRSCEEKLRAERSAHRVTRLKGLCNPACHMVVKS